MYSTKELRRHIYNSEELTKLKEEQSKVFEKQKKHAAQLFLFPSDTIELEFLLQKVQNKFHGQITVIHDSSTFNCQCDKSFVMGSQHDKITINKNIYILTDDQKTDDKYWNIDSLPYSNMGVWQIDNYFDDNIDYFDLLNNEIKWQNASHLNHEDHMMKRLSAQLTDNRQGKMSIYLHSSIMRQSNQIFGENLEYINNKLKKLSVFFPGCENLNNVLAQKYDSSDRIEPHGDKTISLTDNAWIVICTFMENKIHNKNIILHNGDYISSKKVVSGKADSSKSKDHNTSVLRRICFRSKISTDKLTVVMKPCSVVLFNLDINRFCTHELIGCKTGCISKNVTIPQRISTVHRPVKIYIDKNHKIYILVNNELVETDKTLRLTNSEEKKEFLDHFNNENILAYRHEYPEWMLYTSPNPADF